MSVESTTTILVLDQDSAWNDLHLLFSPEANNAALANLLEQLRAAGATSAIVEHDYLDRDYSEEFKAFYATLFPRYRRHTKRLHFFRADVSDALKLPWDVALPRIRNLVGDTTPTMAQVQDNNCTLDRLCDRPNPSCGAGK